MGLTLTVLGNGGALTPFPTANSNALLMCENGDQYLIDCGITCPSVLTSGLVPELDFDRLKGVFLTHCHSDHAGGLEWLAFYFHFVMKRKPVIISTTAVLEEMADMMFTVLRHSNEADLSDRDDCVGYYFDSMMLSQAPVQISGHSVRAFPVQHVEGMPSVGFIFDENVVWSGDCKECVYEMGLIEEGSIYQDCAAFPNNAHAFIGDLPANKNKKIDVYLIHYAGGDAKQISELVEQVQSKNLYLSGAVNLPDPEFS